MNSRLSIGLPQISIMLIVLLSRISFAQHSINIDGNYTDSLLMGHSIKVSDNKLIVMNSAYEFYGHEHTLYLHTFEIQFISDKTLNIHHKKSKIVSGPKKSGGYRLIAKRRSPNYGGSYAIEKCDNGIIKLTCKDDYRDIILVPYTRKEKN